jgi:integrase
MALTEIEFVEKLKAGTATVEEAIDFSKSSPTLSEDKRKRIGALVSGFKRMGLDITMPYKDLKNDDVAPLFTKAGSPDKANRAPNLQALEIHLETIFNKYGISGIREKVPGSDIEKAMYPKLTGAGTAIGTQRTGMAGERPMRGLLSMEDFTKIYAEAVPLIESEYDQATADLIRYHATTSNRPSQLQKLKKSDVTISGNTITVAGKLKTKTDRKGRPTLTFDLDSPTGQLLKRNLDSSKSNFLFDTTDAKFSDAFAKHITPRLEPFSNLLPLAETKVEGPKGVELSQKPVTSPSAVRSIVSKIMLDQYNIPEALVQGVMGHANPTILRKNYAGLAPSTDLPKLLENPSSFAVGDFGTTEKNINLDLLSDEDRAALIEDQKATLIAEEKARQATAEATIAQQKTAAIKAKAAVTPEEIQAAARVDEETIRANERKKLEIAEIRKDERAKAAKLQAQDVPDSPPNRADLEYTEAEKAQLKARGWKLPTAITAITAGSIATSSDSAKAASEVARDIALDTAAEQAVKLIAKRGLSKFIPGADLVIPSANMGMQTRQEGDQLATPEELETARIQAAQAVKERDAARVQESAIPSQYPNTDNFLNMQP